MPVGNLQHLETVLVGPSLDVAVKRLLLNTAHDPDSRIAGVRPECGSADSAEPYKVLEPLLLLYFLLFFCNSFGSANAGIYRRVTG